MSQADREAAGDPRRRLAYAAARRGGGWWRWLPAAALVLAGCSTDQSSMLHPQGLVAHRQLFWLLYICGFMSIVVVPIFVLVPLFCWRYRLRGGRGQYKPEWDFAWSLEFLIWGVPVAIVVILAILIIGDETKFDPYRPIASDRKPLEIDVIGLNWKWLFIYPEQGVASVGTMAFPTDRPLTFRLTSDKTIQSFFIPALGSQIYAMAGMVTKLNLMADRPGRFVGENTQFNGMQFQRDRFVAHGMTEGDYAAWVRNAKGMGRALDRDAFRRLARDGTVNDAVTSFGADPTAAADPLPRPEPGLQFSSVDQTLFDAVVDRFDASPANTPPPVGQSEAGMPGMTAPATPANQDHTP